MSNYSIIEDAEKATDLFVAVLAKALTNRVLDKAFYGQVTLSQLQGLRYLLHNEQRLMSDLAEGLGISYPAATKTVERLVKKGLVARESDPADRRVVKVQLTERGRQLVEEIDATMNQSLASVLERLSTGDREALLRGMSAFIAAILEDLKDGKVVASICLQCGEKHKGGCPVEEALRRTQKEPTAV
jgi:DNA-binding MarR family transcriptional regulator